jgi:hypothetical protein
MQVRPHHTADIVIHCKQRYYYSNEPNYWLCLIILHSAPQQINAPEQMEDRPLIGRLRPHVMKVSGCRQKLAWNGGVIRDMSSHLRLVITTMFDRNSGRTVTKEAHGLWFNMDSCDVFLWPMKRQPGATSFQTIRYVGQNMLEWNMGGNFNFIEQ